MLEFDGRYSRRTMQERDQWVASEGPGGKGSGVSCARPGPHVIHGLSYVNLLMVQSKEVWLSRQSVCHKSTMA